MNQSALKTFAQDARNKLRQLIGARLDYVLTADTAELRQQSAQVNELRKALQEEGRDPLLERVAYTWFNRLAALRFMDANGYHPFGARVITPATANETLPELLQQARSGALDADLRASIANPKTFDDLLAGRIPVDHPEAQVFKLLLVATCNYYHRLMPFLFEKIGDATELLLPEDLLTEHSIVADFRENLADEDCREVEVIGWLYQFYISERKDAVMARKSAVPTEDIPAVTQLFTPHWIVRYLVENSLGRLWLLNRPHSRLREKMPYYIEGEPETDFLKITKPEDIRLLDPAAGSGHMLTYAFDLLYAIYEEEGYDAPEIPSLILGHNLYGVEICDRAAALAAFALCMKARSRDHRYFRRLAKGGDDAPRPHILELRDVRFDDGELSAYFKALGAQPSAIHPELNRLLHQFEEAKNFGSLIQPCLTGQEIQSARSQIGNRQSAIGDGDLMVASTHLKVLRVLEQAEALTQRYHVVVANPPYMGGKGMNGTIKQFLLDNFADYKSDLFAAFIVRSLSLSLSNGYLGFMSPFVWMFISSYEELRKRLISDATITTLVQLEYSGFDGATVPICTFALQNKRLKNYRGGYVRLSAFRGSENQGPKTLEAVANPNCGWFFRASTDDFKKIPGSPIAYWASQAIANLFAYHSPLSKSIETREGLTTGSNETFLRFWFEVAIEKVGFSLSTTVAAAKSGNRWFPHLKGGGFRRWSGNFEYVVDWENDGERARNFTDPDTGRVRSHNYNGEYGFREGLTWSGLSSGVFSVRFVKPGHMFDAKAPMAFAKDATTLNYVLLFLNSTVAGRLIEMLAPTLDFKIGHVLNLPLVAAAKVIDASSVVKISQADWDNFETSWDFRDQPLLRPGLKGATLDASWRNWEAQSTAAIRRMQELETENNRLFIAAYGLAGELPPEVPEAQITLARADARRDMAAFLSYAVGCMMGRYSPDHPGLILANAGDTVESLKDEGGSMKGWKAAHAGESEPFFILHHSSFIPDQDGILPVLDGEWFQDDIVGRFREFLRVTYGEESLAENLAFIEASLGKLDAKTGKAKPTDLRTYFVREFYKEHLKTYKKRPIYWMFRSPEGSFQALIYLHRYTRDTVNLLLNDYVREFIGKLEEKHRQLTGITLNESARPGDRTKALKELGKIDKMLKEIKAWERDVLLPLAQQRLELDLDDGVKVNYLKFKGAVVPIPGLEKQEED